MQIATLRKIVPAFSELGVVHSSSFEAVLTGMSVELAGRLDGLLTWTLVLSVTGGLICWRCWRRRMHVHRRLIAKAHKLQAEIAEETEVMQEDGSW